MDGLEKLRATYGADQVAEAEKRMLAKVAEKELLPRVGKQLTLDDVYTRDERLKMAYVPVVMAERIWEYIDRVLDYCAAHRLDRFKKTSRDVRYRRNEYYKFLQVSIDSDHLMKAHECAEEFSRSFGWDLQIMWLTLNGELKKLHPNMPDIEMGTDVLCAVSLLRTLKRFCNDIDSDIEKKMHCRSNTFNPKLWNLDNELEGYIEGYAINRTELINRCEIILRRNMETIKYKE